MANYGRVRALQGDMVSLFLKAKSRPGLANEMQDLLRQIAEDRKSVGPVGPGINIPDSYNLRSKANKMLRDLEAEVDRLDAMPPREL
jgi:hypothetical protein